MSRLFVAVWPPPEVVAALSADLGRGRGGTEDGTDGGAADRAEPGVRWVAPHRWHVTLRFLGEADEDAAVAALGTLGARGCRAVLGPRVERLGRRVVCLPVHGLDEVAAAVEAATSGVGRSVDPRPFSAHITLARLRRGAGCAALGRAVGGAFDVRSVDLVRSATEASGTAYETLITVPLEP